ncbi:MAG: hypothetical protein HC923_10275 [Myxococcales bacterium]|nr:hypothetical protein [Myxococcales bacterium]
MIELPSDAPMREYQRYIRELEELHGWTQVDLVHNCFLMGEEVGELFKAVRRHDRLFLEGSDEGAQVSLRAQVGEEIIDVLNYLIAIANRLNLSLEDCFRQKNLRNQTRTWDKGSAEPT